MRCKIQSYSTKIPLDELLMFQFPGIKIQNVVMDLIRPLNIFLFDSFGNYIINILWEILPKAIKVFRIHKFTLEDTDWI